MATSETAWCWVATDYTDNQPQVEQFAVKFKVSQEMVLGGGEGGMYLGLAMSTCLYVYLG